MTERQRWRLWVGVVVGGGVALTIGMALALALESRTGVLAAIVFGPVFAVVIVATSLRARRRPGLLVPPYLQGLQPEQRRIVTATANRAARADDPDLRPAVVAYARNQRTAMALSLVGGALAISVRLWALASGNTSGAFFDVLMVAVWLVLAAGLARYVLRAHRAMSANRPMGPPTA